MAEISVWLDKDDQLICQRIEGALTAPEFQRMLDLTGQCVAQLSDPGDIRILVDARTMDGSDRTTRRLGMATLKGRNVSRMALWGGRGRERAVQRFMMALVGERRLQMFASEEDARAWLKEGRLAPVPRVAGAPEP